MRKRHVAAFTVLLTLAMSSNAFAVYGLRTARSEVFHNFDVLAGPIDFMKDCTDAYKYPANLGLYGNTLLLNPGRFQGGQIGPNSRSATVWSDLGRKYGSVGLGIAENDYTVPDAPFTGDEMFSFVKDHLPDIYGDAYDAQKMGHQFDLYYGREMTNKLNLGARLSVGGDDHKFAMPAGPYFTYTDRQEVGIARLHVSALCLVDGDRDGTTIDVGIGGRKLWGSREINTPDKPEVEMNGHELDLDARMFYRLREGVHLVPLLHLASYNRASWDSTNTGQVMDGLESKGTGLYAGLGVNSEVAKGARIVVAAVARRYSWTDERKFPPGSSAKYEMTTSHIIFPGLHMGAEVPISGWLTGRVGVNKNIWRYIIEPDQGAGRLEIDDAHNLWVMNYGIGINKGNLQLDAVLNDSSLYSGGFLFNGYQARDPLASFITLKYTWE